VGPNPNIKRGHAVLSKSIDADMSFVPRDLEASANSWWLKILDESDRPGALGYHEVTGAGLPLGKVFAKTAQEDNSNWTVTASHELLNMLVDPRTNVTVAVEPENSKTATFYALEVGDPCEAEDYDLLGYKVTDFVCPAWFDSWRKPASTQFYFGQHIHRPLELLPGGYIQAFIAKPGSEWTTIVKY
jgi:hypothetical protein